MRFTNARGNWIVPSRGGYRAGSDRISPGWCRRKSPPFITARLDNQGVETTRCRDWIVDVKELDAWRRHQTRRDRGDPLNAGW